jgi:hypothetical protein
MTDIVGHLIEHATDVTIVDPALRIAAGMARDEFLKFVGPEWADNLRNLRDRFVKKSAGKKFEQPPLSVTLPLLEAARNEHREELVEIWASLLATAADPARRGIYRAEFVEIARKLDPLDALVLPKVAESGEFDPTKLRVISDRLQAPELHIENSFRNLARLDLAAPPPHQLLNARAQPYLTALGRQFLMAVRG